VSDELGSRSYLKEDLISVYLNILINPLTYNWRHRPDFLRIVL
jgi:hypothetical protein